MKDSTVLLQKRLLQERDQEEMNEEKLTLHLYKVYTQDTKLRISEVFFLLFEVNLSACCLFVHTVGVYSLVVCHAA